MERVRGGGNAMRDLSSVLPTPAETGSSTTGKPEPAATKPDTDAELKKLRESALEDGYRQGIAKAQQEIDAAVSRGRQELERKHASEAERLKSSRERMAALAASIEAAVGKARDEVTSLAVEIGFMAATRVLGEFAQARTLVAALCRQALDEHLHRPVVVRVSSVDLSDVREAIDGDGVSVEVDTSMRPGSCRLETRRGDYETHLDERLEAVKAALLRAVAAAEERAS